MKLLFISPDTPFPANSGGRIRVFNIIKQLSADHQVDLVYMSDTPEASRDIERAAGINKAWHLTRPSLPKWQKLLPWSSLYRNKELSQDLVKIISQVKPDVVFVEFSFTLPLIAPIRPQFPHTKFILDAHNIEHQLHQEIANSSTSLPFKIYKHVYAHFLKKTELGARQYIDTIIAVSDQEAQTWRQLCPTVKVVIAPNGVDLDYFKSTNQTIEPDSLVFCGLMDYRPNVDAMLWFSQAIWPIVLAARPQAKLYIVGRNPAASVVQLASQSNITVTGSVDDVRDWVGKADLSIVPLRSGAGTRLKILEAMAMSKVIISTTLGAAGLQPSPGIILADSSEQFAQHIIKQFQSTTSAELGKRNRQLAERTYAWSIIVKDLVSQLELNQNHHD